MGNKANFSESLLQEDADRFLESESSVSVDYCHRQESGFSILEKAFVSQRYSKLLKLRSIDNLIIASSFGINCLIY